MHAAQDPTASVITSARGRRVFPCGRVLRRTKVDELPQLINVLRGEMSLVGPRPEDPKIVEGHYTEEYRTTLEVRPGLASPGSIYAYTHANEEIGEEDAEAVYVHRVLPVKMALERVYVARASLWYDLRIIARTAWVIVALTLGKERFAPPPEMGIARSQGWL